MLVFAVLAAVAGTAQVGPPRAPALVPALRQAQGEEARDEGSGAPAASPPSATSSGSNEVSGVVVTAPGPAPEPAWAKTLNLDPRGDYARSNIPYLRRRPTNGCKLMAGGSASPAGVEGVAAGAACVKRFTSPFR